MTLEKRPPLPVSIDDALVDAMEDHLLTDELNPSGLKVVPPYVLAQVTV